MLGARLGNMPPPGGPAGYISGLPPQTVRPGYAGMNRTEVSDNSEEAALIQNLELAKDRIWRPRAGLTSRVLFSGDIQHVSDHPNRSHIMVIEGGRVQYVNSVGWGTTELASGWDTDEYFKSATGIASGTAPPDWVVSKGKVNGDPLQIYKVNASGTLAACGSAVANWVEAYGQYVVGITPGAVVWSEAEDITSFPALNSEPPNPACGRINAFVAISDNQALILGDKGCAVWYGSDHFGQQQLYNLRGIPFGLHAIRCGGSVLFCSPGPQIIQFFGANNHDRVDAPIHVDLRGITNWTYVHCWFDEFRGQYVVSIPSAAGGTNSPVYYLDLESKAWIARNIYKNGAGSYASCLGQAVLPDGGGGSDGRRFIAVGKRLLELSYSVYTDNGDAIECILETAPDDRGLPQCEKVMERVWLEAGGTWTVSLLYRARPGANWTTLSALNTVTGPGWAYFTPTAYTERKLQLVATAASGVDLSRLVVHETLGAMAA